MSFRWENPAVTLLKPIDNTAVDFCQW